VVMLVYVTTYIVRWHYGAWLWHTGKAVSDDPLHPLLLFRHVGDDKGRTYELEQSAVKCLRGILYCYMRQAKKVTHVVFGGNVECLEKLK